jgi:CheY-like chemotaxis protein
MNHNRRVLLVEDDANDAFFMRRALEKCGAPGVHVETMPDAEEAIEYLSASGRHAARKSEPPPRVVLLDIKLPGRSGHEFLAWMRDYQPCRRVRVAVLTSSRERRDINLAYDLGATSYFVKPVDATDLDSLARSIATYWLVLNNAPDQAPDAP